MKAPGTEHTGSGPFQEIDGAKIVTCRNGIYDDFVRVFRRGETIYGFTIVNRKNAMFCLKSDGKTTIDNLKWDEIIGVEVEFSALGRMVVKS